MIIEVEKKNEPPQYKDLKVGATFYLNSQLDNCLYLKTRAHPNTSMNCVNLTKGALGVCDINTPVIVVETKVVNV